jgi:hypothetical protein
VIQLLLALAVVVGLSAVAATASRAASSRQVFFTTWPGTGQFNRQNLRVKPVTLQMSGDASWIIDTIRWSSWGGLTAHGAGVSDVETCNPNCAAGGVVTAASRITLSKIGLADGVYVYQCYRITSSGPSSLATSRAHQAGCIAGASALPRPAGRHCGDVVDQRPGVPINDEALFHRVTVVGITCAKARPVILAALRSPLRRPPKPWRTRGNASGQVIFFLGREQIAGWFVN